ncbi:MAG: FadR family transcriptional regulator [Acidimicrobiales bacterium]|nr:FadR family transcriptional regulator [Acidimicrobiales bacterium]
MSDEPILSRVRAAYEQVADQLRTAILRGDFPVGERLPREADLAEMLGVSRSTVREALRVLGSERLVHTTQGATGGTFIMQPSLDYLSEFLTRQYQLLSATETVTFDDMVELRNLLETEAARLAAIRRTDAELERLALTVPEPDATLDIDERNALNRSFHLTLLELAHNPLLEVSVLPVYTALDAFSRRSLLSQKDHSEINSEHLKILEAVRAGDEARAGKLAHEHLQHLRGISKRVWRGKV